MSEKIKILGVDPSLRNTGLCVLGYNTEKRKFSKPEHCCVLVNQQKYTGKDALMNMLDMIQTASRLPIYQNVDNVIVESPAVMFNQAWAIGTISTIAHISGGAIALFGIEKTFIYKPSEWNKGKKKEVTHAKTVEILGDPETWGYYQAIKSEKRIEHILDAASMAMWFINDRYK